MEITKEVIRDLLPLYFENEVSADSRKIIESYFSKHPEFAEEAKKQNLYLESIEIKNINKEEEMVTLQKTKKLVRVRSLIMGFAIFFTMLPFSFGGVPWDNNVGTRWLFNEYPLYAISFGVVGIGLWIAYLILQKTKKMARLRPVIIGFAIFFTALPFSFGSVSWDNYDGVRWLWSHNPLFAIYLGLIGLGLWTVYYFINRRLSI
ncbi:MAG: hypothetical protein HND50_05710 [Calditrichaeota bacterium]|nr:hypothetical protein [Calditrichota bacterium]